MADLHSLGSEPTFAGDEQIAAQPTINLLIPGRRARLQRHKATKGRRLQKAASSSSRTRRCQLSFRLQLSGPFGSAKKVPPLIGAQLYDPRKDRWPARAPGTVNSCFVMRDACFGRGHRNRHRDRDGRDGREPAMNLHCFAFAAENRKVFRVVVSEVRRGSSSSRERPTQLWIPNSREFVVTVALVCDAQE